MRIAQYIDHERVRFFQRSANALLFLAVSLCCTIPLAANERLLGQGDVVELTVYRQPDLSTVGRLGSDGALGVPLVGEVVLGGKTEREAEREIAHLLSAGRFVKNPQVMLYIRDYLSHQVSILGHVSQPGRYAFETGDSIVDIIALAGGFREDASGTIVINRVAGDGTEHHRIDVERSLVDGSPDAIQHIRDGDVLYALRMEVFYVYGEVQQPGMYRLDTDVSVMQAIAVAGSLTDEGSARGIQIRRRTEAGDVKVVKADLADFVEPGDIIQVKESLF